MNLPSAQREAVTSHHTATTRSVRLNAAIIEAFAGTFLSPRYDNPVPTPQFHREGWDLYASDAPQVVLVAPRENAKSTAMTFDYILAECLFRRASYVILIGSTEGNAAEQLSNIIEEIRENDDLRDEFGIAEIERDSRTDLIVRMDDGHRWRVLACGCEQKIRGKMWNGKRPDLIVGDDMEDDEQVQNRDRRIKFRRWFFRAAKQALGRKGRIRVHGTILDDDSLLSRLIKCPKCKVRTQVRGIGPCPKCGTEKIWRHLFFKAHESFDDFSNILWPEAWSKERLKARRQEFVEDGDAGGYSQEFLNDPQDNAEAYLRKQDFLEMESQDYKADKLFRASIDFAVSKADLANRTSITVGGKCLRNLVHVVDQRVGRWASVETLSDGQKVGWIEEMFSVQKRWNPDMFIVESGQIWASIQHIVYNEMRERDLWINIVEVNSSKDKATMGRTFQKQHRAGGMRFDKQADWYAAYENELLKFTGGSQAILDDQFDSTAKLMIGFELEGKVDEDDFTDAEELEILRDNRAMRGRVEQDGRSETTGY